jgi:hypothetical protein
MRAGLMFLREAKARGGVEESLFGYGIGERHAEERSFDFGAAPLAKRRKARARDRSVPPFAQDDGERKNRK